MPKTLKLEIPMFLEIIAGVVVLASGKYTHSKIQARKVRKSLALEKERIRTLLSDVCVTVFVRQPNGSQTDLERHIEQALICRGARVVLANQKKGSALLRRGEYSELNPNAHMSVVGTLVIKDGGLLDTKVFTESEHDFNVREADHELRMDSWRMDIMGETPRPQLRERGFRIEQVPYWLYQFSFRILGRDGTVLASGLESTGVLKSQVSFNTELRTLADRSVQKLDDRNIWTDIAID